jgi:tRNA-2-methylthio-N6-dimethylallyladenosine synthase
LQQLLTSQQQAFNHSKLDQVMDVLIERPANRAGQKAGRSPWMQAVHFSEDVGQIGDIVPLKIVSATQNSLAGQAVI